MKLNRGKILSTILGSFVCCTLISCKMTDQLAAQTEATNRAAAATEAAVKATTELPENLKGMINGMIPQIQAAAKATGTEMIDEAMQKALVVYMEAQQQFKGTAQDLIRGAGPQLLQALTTMPPDQQAKVEAAFNRLVSNSPVGAIGSQFSQLNDNIANGIGKIDGVMQIANTGIQSAGAIGKELGTLNQNIAGVRQDVKKVEGIASSLGVNVGGNAATRGFAATTDEALLAENKDIVSLPSELPEIAHTPYNKARAISQSAGSSRGLSR